MSAANAGNADQESAAPRLQVVSGHPSDEELAALLVVLGAARATSAEPAAPVAGDGGWAAYWRTVRAPLAPGPGAWRASGRGL